MAATSLSTILPRLASGTRVCSAAAPAPTWTTSVESGPVHNPAHAGGGPGTTGSGAINVNSGADPSLTLDPTLAMGGGVGGVNELVGVLYDGNAAVLPLYGEIAYSPLYLYPR